MADFFDTLFAGDLISIFADFGFLAVDYFDDFESFFGIATFIDTTVTDNGFVVAGLIATTFGSLQATFGFFIAAVLSEADFFSSSRNDLETQCP